MESGKRKGGGIAMFVNDRWCNPGHIRVKEQYCNRDIKLLEVSILLYYLLRDCFDTTYWDVSCETDRDDTDSLTTCITDYINFCVENTVSTRKVQCFSSNKLWVTPELKAPASPPSIPLTTPHHATPLRSLPDRSTHPFFDLSQQESLHGPTNTPSLSITADQVRKELRRTKTRKATCPDHINARLPKDCADQLCVVLLHIFCLSLSLERVPLLWKTSCVVLVPKTAHPREPDHFRPVATSHLMKTMERIILTNLRHPVNSEMDPLQFAYQPGIGVDDAVIYLLHRSLSHLESTGSAVRVMFI